MCVLTAQPTAVRTAYCVINVSKSYLVWSHSFWCDTWVTKTKSGLKLKFSKFSSTRLKLRLKVSWWLKLKLKVDNTKTKLKLKQLTKKTLFATKTKVKVVWWEMLVTKRTIKPWSNLYIRYNRLELSAELLTTLLHTTAIFHHDFLLWPSLLQLQCLVYKTIISAVIYFINILLGLYRIQLFEISGWRNSDMPLDWGCTGSRILLSSRIRDPNHDHYCRQQEKNYSFCTTTGKAGMTVYPVL